MIVRSAELAYPANASGIYIYIFFIKNNHEKSLNLADLVIFSFSLTRTLPIFVGHGIMARMPWPLNQSNSGTALSDELVFSNTFIWQGTDSNGHRSFAILMLL